MEETFDDKTCTNAIWRNLGDTVAVQYIGKDEENIYEKRKFDEICRKAEEFYKLPRKLKEEEINKIKNEKEMNNFKKEKLEKLAKQNWDKFYLRNSDKFYKDREWTQLDFVKYLPDAFDSSVNLRYLEIGCGVGNMLFPIMKQFNHWTFYAFDFSKNAINLLNKRIRESNYDKEKVNVFVGDLTDHEFCWLYSFVDLITAIFVLSSIHPEKLTVAIKNLKKCLKPGGTVIVRDYGIYDYAMLRFGRNSKIAERFYARQDGTRTFYFMLDELIDIFSSEGFRIAKSEYLTPIKMIEHKQVSMERVFVQATFILTSA